LLPIQAYDTDTGHCVVTILRPGKTLDGKEMRAHAVTSGSTHPDALAKHRDYYSTVELAHYHAIPIKPTS
jgi:hypothetical protein